MATMNRRTFLAAAAASMGGALVQGCGGGGSGSGMMGRPAVQPGLQLEQGLALRALAPLANSATEPGRHDAALVAAPASLAFVPGAATPLWLYNGLLPGPLIEVREGDRVRIALENRLPIDTTAHWHGLTVPADQDGNPMDPVRPGATRAYEFDVPRGSAGTYWYHPHAHGTTAEQVARGLAGAFIVRAADDPLAHLPEVTLLVSGLRLDGAAQVSPHGAMDTMLGRQGEQLLVNGGRLPVHTVRPGATQRWRILNATSARYLRLQLDGHTLTLVGADGGLLASPLAGLAEVLVAPAQRVEVVVQVAAARNARYTLRAQAHAIDTMGLGSYVREDLLTLATTADAPSQPVELPAVLRPLPPPAEVTATKRVVLTQSGGMGMMGGTFLINGRSFDMNRVDFVSAVGATEAWEIVNDTFMDHPIHIHGTQFRLLTRESRGRITAAPYAAWLDTVDVPSGSTATILVRQDLPGKRMVHCHILEHEDAGMMAVLEVRPN